MKTIVRLLCVLLLALAAPAQAEEALTPEKRADIQRLLQVTGAMDVGQIFSRALVQQMTETIKRTRPDIPARFFDLVADEVNKTIAEAMVVQGGFVDQVVPVYHRYFSHEEVRALADFYQTPVGRKAVAVMPDMVQESMAIGQRWGRDLGPQIQQRLRARFKQEGVEL